MILEAENGSCTIWWKLHFCELHGNVIETQREGCTFGLPCHAFHTCARWIFKDFYLNIIVCYRPQRSCGNVMFSQASVILFMGACVSQHALGQTPPGRHPPLGRHPPRWPLQRTVRILLECILVL